MSSLSDLARSGRSDFHQVVASFLSQPGLPFAGILSADRIERIFARHGNLFGVGAIYSTAVMVWSFLGQVLRDGKEASCQAADRWLWKGRHAKLVDGFTFTTPDTPENQRAYPQPKTQTAGVGLPIARGGTILSLATACMMDLAIGPYKGKQTGETALLCQLLGSFAPGDVAVLDRYYCSFMMIAG